MRKATATGISSSIGLAVIMISIIMLMHEGKAELFCDNNNRAEWVSIATEALKQAFKVGIKLPASATERPDQLKDKPFETRRKRIELFPPTKVTLPSDGVAVRCTESNTLKRVQTWLNGAIIIDAHAAMFSSCDAIDKTETGVSFEITRAYEFEARPRQDDVNLIEITYSGLYKPGDLKRTTNKKKNEQGSTNDKDQMSAKDREFFEKYSTEAVARTGEELFKWMCKGKRDEFLNVLRAAVDEQVRVALQQAFSKQITPPVKAKPPTTDLLFLSR